MKKLLIIASLLFCSLAFAKQTKPLTYELLKQNNHTIHLLKFDPADYPLQLVRAEANGRETVPSMVARTKALAGINGGFFQTTSGQAKPAGILIIDGQVVSFARGTRSIVNIEKRKITIGRAQVSQKGKSIKLQMQNGKVISNPQNVVTGIPMLVIDGRIATNLDKSGGQDFVSNAHARTAMCVQKNGTVVIAVVEHGYSVGAAVGFTLPELAQFMVSQECYQAINFDGGGSSTLVYEGQLKNKTIGDLDEAMGLQTVRPVTDAIVVQNK